MKIQDLNNESTMGSADMRNTIGGTSNGISALIQVTQLKSQFANDEALEGVAQQPKPEPKKKTAMSTYSFRTNAGSWATFGGNLPRRS